MTTLMTPAGKPAFSTSSMSLSAVADVNSAGFITSVLPAARAGAALRENSSKGAFHGTMPTHTPSGSWREKLSAGLSQGWTVPSTLSA